MKKDIEVKQDKSTQSGSNLFPALDQATENIFEGRFPTFFGDWPTLSRSSAASIREEDDSYVLSANLPGIPKEDIHVQVSGNILTVKAEHKVESGSAKSDAGYRREHRSYHQTFTIPTNVEAEQIEAHCENGRLEVLLPKNAKHQARKIEIQSGKDGFKSRQLGKGQKDSKVEAKEKH